MAPPNQLVSYFDAALPGTLPVLNKSCVEAGVLTALALSCKINHKSLFDRKHYFYADLPAGYQITQQRKPIATDGHLTFNIYEGKKKDQGRCHRVNIKQIQLEQDSGKSLHDDINQETLVDLNRAGVGLMELVTEPDMTSGAEAASFVQELQSVLQTIGTCDGKMAEGSLRVDANISVNKPGDPPGVRTEVKNINSIRFVKNAIEFEIQRQIELLEGGGSVVMETRSLDDSGKTVPMRDKEVVLDYRFMPEPNLPPLIVYNDDTIKSAPNPEKAVNIDDIKRRIPELPEQKRQRLTSDYGISYSNATVLVNEEGLADLFEELYSKVATKDVKSVINWCLIDLLQCLHDRNMTIPTSPVPVSRLVDVLNYLQSGHLSAKSALKLLNMLFDKDSRSVSEIMSQEDLQQINSPEEVMKLCEEVMDEESDMVELYQTNKKVINRLMGSIQKKTKGRVDPKMARKIMEDLLER
ncbi:Glutamyl-tRNA(Gln) amidotransferase subunit B, mitochondrial [Holothuria leucospilota]|uniref:Glutamyl-tRNA(Gln) amidotransferase subunit B, mitochondrial n=1 Tax=Holothuria leucospilota TaxID=206669 RepID=A0A9Q1GZC5_HOLLE|nr:Glutamyl-tRNA(Gln) amidotransferase subunit B, mitochondrial [Holothuria leucospilota]